MKKITLLATCVLLSMQLMAQTQMRKVENKTKCDVTVTMECYDLCALVSSFTQTFFAGTSGSISVSPCPTSSANFIIFRVCWKTPNGICPDNLPPAIPCTRVDGSNPSAPAPCSPGTFTDKIQYCKGCAPNNNGIANVQYDPVTGILSIIP